MLENLPEVYKGKVTSPAANHLFEVNENGIPLDSNSRDLYHNFVVRLLYLEKRARPDILTAIDSLPTRVEDPDANDQK